MICKWIHINKLNINKVLKQNYICFALKTFPTSSVVKYERLDDSCKNQFLSSSDTSATFANSEVSPSCNIPDHLDIFSKGRSDTNYNPHNRDEHQLLHPDSPSK